MKAVSAAKHRAGLSTLSLSLSLPPSPSQPFVCFNVSQCPCCFCCLCSGTRLISTGLLKFIALQSYEPLYDLVLLLHIGHLERGFGNGIHPTRKVEAPNWTFGGAKARRSGICHIGHKFDQNSRRPPCMWPQLATPMHCIARQPCGQACSNGESTMLQTILGGSISRVSRSTVP